MPDNKTKPTPQQLKAMTTIDRSVMVTASAGTGKTAVLSARCANIVSDPKNAADVSSLLVLTFTEAAADEMKSRIAGLLRQKYLQNYDPNIKRQMLLLDSAQISTIHSFCKTIITENFHLIGVDPGFSIIDSDEQALIKSEVLQEIVENAWADPNLSQQLKQLLFRRDADLNIGFLRKIISINDFLDSLEDRDLWSKNSLLYSCTDKAISEKIQTLQLDYIKEKLQRCIDLTNQSLAMDKKLADTHWQQHIREQVLEPFETAQKFAASDLKKLSTFIENYTKENFPRVPKGLDSQLKDIILEPVKDAISIFKSLKNLALLDSEYETNVGLSAGLQTQFLVRLVRDFNVVYDRRKREINSVDFADLEHLAMKLLSDEKNQPSEVARQLREKFKYIFIDEYQDINNVQQAIIDRISRCDNVFGVGDIKQSIYAFRQARPEIFGAKISAAQPEPEKNDTAIRIDLSKNFRSRKGVLDFVNLVFSRIMSRQFCDIDYDEHANLISGFDYQSSNAPAVELNIIDEDDQNENDEIFHQTSKTQRQALLVGQRIKNIIETEKPQIYDRHQSCYRPASYGDVVVLMRSLSMRLNEYIEIFRMLDIPVSTSSNSGYFEATEVRDCISLLKILDNPATDIELAAVMRSPLFEFNENQLAMIRYECDAKNQSLDFWQCLADYVETGSDTDLKQKVQNFTEQIESWTCDAHKIPLADLIWQILRYENYFSFVGSLPNGTQRRQNLLKLHERAIQFENFVTSAQSASLARFIDFIDDLLDQSQDWAPAQTPGEGVDGVRIINVHQSKGLEYPIVVLAGLSTEFNKSDTKDEILLDSEISIGMKVINSQTCSRHESAAYQIIKERLNRTNLAEEMRILYVAMTRARERLILFGNMTTNNVTKILTKSVIAANATADVYDLQKAHSHFDWIINSLACTKQLHDLYRTDYANQMPQPDYFTANLYGGSDISDFRDIIENLKTDRKKDNAKVQPENIDTQALLENLQFQYPHIQATTVDSKTSASRITADNLSKVPPAEDFVSHQAQPIEEIKFNADSSTADHIGTATHTVIQNIDISKIIDQALIEETVKNLADQNIIASDIANKIDKSAILEFFNSELGTIALDQKNKVFREWQFTCAQPADLFNEKCKDDFVIVQGMIDMLIQTNDGLIVIDFKTDNVNMENLPDRVNTYSPQIQLYAKAASDILNLPTIGRYLFFLKLGEKVQI